MNRQVVVRSPPLNRRTPLLPEKSAANGRDRRRIGEVAGRTAAECTAVCCCCPCTVVNLLVLALYKVPVGICRRAWAKRRMRRQLLAKRNGLLQQRPAGPDACRSTVEELEAELRRVKEGKIDGGNGGGDAAFGAVDFPEEEMWDRFYNTGFWRSPSQRESCP
ncbi:hypothetical protein L484_017152 [Morus notabilis]|uniref:Uncharacterized protein n=1 Tax=Morus notabilis TaxID=981085 RepID=W9QVY0_9ROSA|nr:uncharacterized protein LOC21400167 [Morus notabilis]XP_024017530.1 uncharacterized protein LOC21400167 [Morus notabilis]EXB39674.1 hypothetical protein L484_017152 [Morus notabilis]